MSRPRGTRTGKFRSKFEAKFSSQFPYLTYESTKIRYEVPASNHTYTPDFQLNSNTFLEAKGIFGPKDRQKLLLVKQQHPDITIILVFQNPRLVLGKRLGTVSEWAKKNGFQCVDGNNLEEIAACLNKQK